LRVSAAAPYRDTPPLCCACDGCWLAGEKDFEAPYPRLRFPGSKENVTPERYFESSPNLLTRKHLLTQSLRRTLHNLCTRSISIFARKTRKLCAVILLSIQYFQLLPPIRAPLLWIFFRQNHARLHSHGKPKTSVRECAIWVFTAPRRRAFGSTILHIEPNDSQKSLMQTGKKAPQRTRSGPFIRGLQADLSDERPIFWLWNP